MSDLSKIIKSAKKALDVVENGKTYLPQYVINRFESASLKYPQDQLIGNMRDVLIKKAKRQDFFTQKQLADIYQEMQGLAGGQTAFKEQLSDLLPDGHGVIKKAEKDYSKQRANQEESLKPIHEDSDLSKAFASIFSVEANGGFGSYSDNLAKKAKKFVEAQLNSLGLAPQNIKASHGNEHFILCVATYDSPDFTQTHVHIPVPCVGGSPQLPENFIQDEQLVALTKENILVHLKDATHHRTKKAHNKFATERPTDSVRAEPAVLPSSLERLADLENHLIAAASKFATSEINIATNVVANELIALGLSNPQPKLSHSDAKGLIFDVQIPTKVGNAVISVPVEMHNGRPLLPSKFAVKESKGTEQIYDFDRSGMTSFLSSFAEGSSNLAIARQAGPMNQMSYHELMDKIIEGVEARDYRLAEDALSVIGQRFDASQYRTAFKQFASLLKRASNNTERKELIKKALIQGDLVMVPTSVEPYCPKLGLPVSKIDFDEKGRPTPRHRRASADNAIESGAHISSSKIYLS